MQKTKKVTKSEIKKVCKMTTLENKIKAYKAWHFDYNAEKPEISASEIRKAVVGKVSSLEGIEFLIRIQYGHGRNNGGTNKSAAMGAKYDYFGLKEGKIVETPFFAPDYRYFDKTGVEDCRCLELEDKESLRADEQKAAQKVRNSTNVFRKCFAAKAAKYDTKHGSENWWVEGTTKTGFEVFFNA
jgi:hypothetical protein